MLGVFYEVFFTAFVAIVCPAFFDPTSATILADLGRGGRGRAPFLRTIAILAFFERCVAKLHFDLDCCVLYVLGRMVELLPTP